MFRFSAGREKTAGRLNAPQGHPVRFLEGSARRVLLFVKTRQPQVANVMLLRESKRTRCFPQTREGITIRAAVSRKRVFAFFGSDSSSLAEQLQEETCA